MFTLQSKSTWVYFTHPNINIGISCLQKKIKKNKTLTIEGTLTLTTWENIALQHRLSMLFISPVSVVQ